MPKSLVLGNGSILVSLDFRGQVRDFYFPFVGLENQSEGCLHRIGFWVDGEFSWLDNPEWQISIDYQKEALASKITALNERLRIEANFLDAVYNEKNIFIRSVKIKNLASKKRTVKLFFGQQFRIYEISHGDTAYYDPDCRAIVHYKGRRVFIVSGSGKTEGFDCYNIGLFGIEGWEGAWKDAEDGILSENPIEHGSVDSVGGFVAEIDPYGSQLFTYWLLVAETIPEAKELLNYVTKTSPEHILETTQDFWRAWVNKLDFDFSGIGEDVTGLFKKSLLIVRTHADNHGAIIASADSDLLQYGRDTYGYMWPRDGAFTAIALDKAGYYDVSRKFFEFCNDVIHEDGYLLHKYRPDRSLGSSWHPWIYKGKKQLAIQEDETALTLFALWHHYSVSRDLEFVEKIYNSFIKKAGDFIHGYRDPETGLPYGSYDLWEERFGVSAFTASSVFGALNAASRFAALLGKENESEKYFRAAEEVRQAIISFFYNEKSGFFYRMLNVREGPVCDETFDVSSFFGVFRFGVLAADDPRLKRAFFVFQKRLCCKTSIGGTVRYEGDKYRRVGDDLPGNPWAITTLWLAQYLIARANSESELKEAYPWLEWMVRHALPSGILSEQFNPYTGEEISAAPLTWSHAEFIFSVIQYLEKHKELKEKR